MEKQSLRNRLPFRYRACALYLAVVTAIAPASAGAATATIPGFYGAVPMPNAPKVGTVPVLLPGGTLQGVSGAPVTSGSTVTVNQNAPQAIIDWKSFNLAPGSVVVFNQKAADATGQLVAQPQWAALNRIYDKSASLIFGSIKADGKVYLINRNGILFGPGSRVDVHSLVASALNITNDDFKNGKLRFTTAAYDSGQGALSSDTTISNYGTITTDSGGSVFFVGPRVENAGTISSPAGKIDLVGVSQKSDGSVAQNGEVEIAELTSTDTTVDVIYSDAQVLGAASNLAGGKLVVDTGRIGMFGATVQNDGLIRAVTALKKGGVVYLAARDSVATGAASRIETPINDSSDTAHPSYVYAPGSVTLTGITSVADSFTPLKRIEHLGAIDAPSGTVTLNATERVFLGETSSISVAGLWLDRVASANLMEAQLNTVELRDEFSQKGGILQGKTIKVDLLTGSTIGDLSGHYLGLDSGAQERSTIGGTIAISGSPSGSSPLKELIVKDGALLDFSGGGTRYAAGNLSTTKLLSGSTIYGIASAPNNLHYDAVADSQTRTHQRFGVTDSYQGLYYGGASALGGYTGARTAGSAAGKADLEARVMVLDGALKGTSVTGLYQTKVTATAVSGGSADEQQAAQDAHDVSVVRGLERPSGGTLQLGHFLAEQPPVSGGSSLGEDAVLTGATIQSTTTKLSTDFKADTVLTQTGTYLSAATLNQASLGALNIYANTTVTVDEGARLSLKPGASLTARAGRIEQRGEIEIPSGTVTLGVRDTIAAWEYLPSDLTAKNSQYQPVVSNIILAAGSSISVAGQRVDNSATAGNASALTAGGSISLVDASFQSSASYSGKGIDVYGREAQGHLVDLAYGALLDVSGGYLIDAKGKITGGDAGSLTMKAPTLSLSGEVRGYSLAGKKGGALTLHAGDVVVAPQGAVLPDNVSPDGALPEYLNGKLVLGDDRLKDTGFSRISLVAINDVEVRDGAQLSPSLSKLSLPEAALVSQSSALSNLMVPAAYDTTSSSYLGATSLSLTAGRNIYVGDLPTIGSTGSVSSSTNFANLTARVSIAADASLNGTPGGSISIKAPVVDIMGTVEARGGSITVSASGASGGLGNLTLYNGAKILAGGYNKPDSTLVAGQSAGAIPQAGGTVSLSADRDIVLEAGSLVDVSGSTPVQRLVQGNDGKVVAEVVAGNPGALTLAYGNQLVLDGTLAGASRLSGQPGATLTVASKVDLTLNQSDVDRYLKSGFDALNFVATNTGASGSGGIVLAGQLDLAAGRSLTLDAMTLTGAGEGQVTLAAPWVRLLNSNTALNSAGSTADTGSAALTVKGGFVDVEGNLLVQGFKEITLAADHDLRFADRTYTVGSNTNYWSGRLAVTGNLTLRASRVYPTSATSFTVATPGKVTILPGAVDASAVYSAGGSLAIEAAGGIEQRGTLLAPQGSITLDAGASGQVLLAEGSITSTAGAASVAYGIYDGSAWMTHATQLSNGGYQNTGTEITGAPTKSVTLNGNEVVVNQGATLDVSGGGSIYAAQFQSGTSGTINPLAASTGRYVILPDRSVTLPGAAVYLDAIPALGLAAGVYSLLPADKYANVAGALIVQDTGVQAVAGQTSLTSQGYRVVSGYATVTDTRIASQAREGYSVRRASDVLAEGDFTSSKQYSSGNGGNIDLTATGAVLNGTLKAQPLDGYQGGELTLSAKNIVAQAGAASLQQPLSFGDPLPQADTLILDTAAVSDKGFSNLTLGGKTFDSATNKYNYLTDTVTLKSGSTLQAGSVTLRAGSNVTIEADARIEATGSGQEGVASIEVPNGSFSLNQGALVHATNALSFDVGNMSLLGDFRADHSKLSISADNLIFAEDTQSSGLQGLYLDKSRVDSLKDAYDDLTLTSRGSMDFRENVALTTKGSLTLDAGSYTAAAGLTVSFSAGTTLTLLNSSGQAPAGTTGAGSSTLKFSAAGIDLVPLSGISFDRFANVTLESSKNDLTLKGSGSITLAQDLTILAPRVTTSFYQRAADPTNQADSAIPYTVADITLDAKNGKVSIAGNGAVAGSSATPGGSLKILGASISVGDTSDQHFATVLESAAGRLQLSATGDLSIGDGTSIRARGAASVAESGSISYYSGGQIALESASGNLTLAKGSILDVSAVQGNTGQGDAGSIRLSAVNGGVGLAGILKGGKSKSSTALGGSFSLDTLSLAGVGKLDGLSVALETSPPPGGGQDPVSGGFDNEISIRSRSAETVSLAHGSTLKGRHVVLSSDQGALDIAGTVSADAQREGEAGGRVELYASTSLILENGARVSATGGKGADGGSVSLSTLATGFTAGHYALELQAGSHVDVSGGAQGAGGSVSFRAYQLGDNDVNLAALPVGAIVGAQQVSVEAAKSETLPVSSGSSAVSITDLSKYTDAAALYLNLNGALLKSRLFANAATGTSYHLRAGIELVSADSMTLDTAWNLAARPGGEAGVLTLRSGKDLTLNQGIYDAPTGLDTLHHDTMQPTWGINLIAGADRSAANYKAILSGGALAAGSGNLTIADKATVYSENGDIYFAAAKDATFAGFAGSSASDGPGFMINRYMKYNLGSYGGTVTGVVGGDLNLKNSGSVIQTALGDIALTIGHDVNLATDNGSIHTAGAIRTTGEYDNSVTQVEIAPNSELGQRDSNKKTTQIYQAADGQSYWLYHNGGNIKLDVGHAVKGAVTDSNSNYGWDDTYIGDKVTTSANYNYDKVPTYLGASFGDLNHASANQASPAEATIGIATLGGGDITVRTGGSFLSPIGAFGTRNSSKVSLTSGGDIDGRFRIMNGSLNLLGSGGFGTKESTPVIEMAAATVSLAVQGDVHLGAVYDPDNLRSGLFPSQGITSQYMWHLAYDQNASVVKVASLKGDLVFYGTGNDLPKSYLESALWARLNILPASFELSAAGDLGIRNNFYLAPSATGSLGLYAGGNIEGLVDSTSGVNAYYNSFTMADAPAATVYGWQRKDSDPDAVITNRIYHYETLHLGDSASSRPVTVAAGGDIVNLFLTVNGGAEVSAKENIIGLDFVGQNTVAGQVTTISAGGSILEGSASATEVANAKTDLSKYFPGIVLGGPGDLVISAKSIDLGNSRGIQTVGKDNNSLLTGDANLTVVVGAEKTMSASDAAAFFYGQDNRSDHADEALNGIQKAGDEYAALKSEGKAEDAQARIDKAREGIIRPYFAAYDKDAAAKSDAGSINMTRSEIKSVTGAIRVLAQGDINLGVTALSSKSTESTGITTREGGQIAIYSGGSTSVNESRVMTFMGGDITMWSDFGDINAGRGSKTTTSPPTQVLRHDDPQDKNRVTGITYLPPSVGSGVRALTYDPDGPTGPQSAPKAGDVHIVAPNGVINAGEAGIVGGTITLGATQVLNVQNISFSAGSVGVPAGDSSVSLGALGGNSNLTDSAKMIEQASTLGAVKEKSTQQAGKVDDFMSRWLDLKIISFDDDPAPAESDAVQEKAKTQKKK